MLTIRLQRVGRKNDPSFRVVVVDSHRSSKTGNFLEVLGSYNARQKEKTILKTERIKHWLSVGAKPSDTAHNLLVKKQLIAGHKINVAPRKPAQAAAEVFEASPAPAVSETEIEVPAAETAPVEAASETVPVETPVEETSSESAA